MNLDLNQLPQGLDESTLLALIEGDLRPSLENEVRSKLAASPELTATIDRMIADRRTLSLLPAVPVPSGLVEAAIAQAQRETMTSLKLVEAEPSPIAISTSFRTHQGWWTRSKVAAALLLAVGSLVVYTTTRGSKPSGNPLPVDLAPLTNNTVSPNRPSTPQPLLADNLPGVDPTPPAVPSDDIPDTRLAVAPATGPVVVFPMLPAQTSEDRLQRALALAREGRLVVRVIARTPAAAQSEVAALSSRRESGRIWTLNREAPAEIIAAVARPAAQPSPRPQEPVQPLLADSQWQVPMRQMFRVDPSLPTYETPQQREKVCLASVSPSIGALQSLQTVLTERLGAVEFAELASSAQSAQAPAVTAESLLWWTQSPALWSAWIDVPVVVEGP
ncbi:MAG: hypothetical protein AABZ53_07710 [Planctomycetota bacterium]